MRKLILVIVVMASAFALQAQKVSEYTASNGKVYKVNHTLIIGIPSNGNGTFKSITNMTVAYANAFGGSNEDTGASAQLSGIEVPIKKIKMRKIFGQKKPFISIGRGYIINLEAAIKLKEVQ